MKKLKKILSHLPSLLLWAFIAVFLWTWIFTFLTDTRAENKLALYADVPAIRKTELALRLESEAFPGIRMVTVHEFSDVLFDGDPLRKADLYILPESRVPACQDWFAPLPEDFSGFVNVLEINGVAFGLPVYLPGTGVSVAPDLIDYALPDGSSEAFYLFFGNRSVHLDGNAGAVDNLSFSAAEALLKWHE